MSYRKFSADSLFDGYRLSGKEMVLITTQEGKVENIVNAGEAGDDVEHFDGILTPGFINSHCHLELSHLKDVIPPHTGLIEFLCSVVTKRGFEPAVIQQKIRNAEKEMYDNGIVAVGDIGNTADTAFVKSSSKISWQNFVEVLGFTDEKATENIAHYKKVAKDIEATLQNSRSSNPTSDFRLPSFLPRHQTSLVPHAPYSISPKTFELINKETAGKVISIHNQEHPAEDVLYKTGGGDYLKLFKIFGIDKSPFPITGVSSIRSVLPHFNNGQTIFLIHNTYMPEEDIAFANEYAAKNGLNLVYCFCINANLYIENKTPVIENFIRHNCHIVLGTDSYSSNWQLSIAKEIQSFKNHFPELSLETILRWATIDGAKALRWDDVLGSFEKGKKPGVTLLDQSLSTSKKIL